MANYGPHDSYYGSDNSAATRLAVSQGLTSPAAVNTGLPKQRGIVNEEGVLIIDEKGTKQWLTPDQFGAQDDQNLWMSNKKTFYNELYTNEKQLQLDNYERYVVATGNSNEARLLYDKDGKNGYSDSYNSGIYLEDDTYNVLNRSYGFNETLARQYFTKYPAKVGTMTVPQAAKAFLDEAGVVSSAAALKKARDSWNNSGGRSGGGRITTVSRTKELTGQQLRGGANDTAQMTMGRTLGVGEADEVVKGLNAESRKNPEVTTGYGTGNQKTTGGYDFRQGLEDALAGTVDGEAYQKVTRGINLLERAMGGLR